MITNIDKKPYYLYQIDADGDHRPLKYFSPLCINCFRLDMYKSWKIDQILVFEAFIVYSLRYGNGFYRTRKKMMGDLRISKHSLLKNISFFIEKKYLKKKLSSEIENYKNIYTIFYDKIISDLKNIYNFEIVTDEDHRQLLVEMYTRLFENYKRKSMKKDDPPYPFRPTERI